jgi:hypothetical protein
MAMVSRGAESSGQLIVLFYLRSAGSDIAVTFVRRADDAVWGDPALGYFESRRDGAVLK